jgi:uncharacterized protein (TIGR02186 family)
LLALLLLLTTIPAGAEGLVTTVSNTSVQITSSFDGAVISLFGNIEADPGAPDPQGPFNIIITITGPLQDRVARLKTNVFGIWTNTDQTIFRKFPSFYAVLSSGKLNTIADLQLLAEEAIQPEDQALIASQDSAGAKASLFGQQLVRLMEEQGHFITEEDEVRFLSTTAYVAQVTLPSDVPNGNFLAHTIVLDKNKHKVAENTQGFSVRKTGFENFVFVASRQQPLLYGIVCVVLALGTGWLAGVVFRR